jgi:mutator protein MutT
MTNKPKPHIHVTAGLIFKEGSILIARRPQGYHLAGLWEFPGGKQEPYETLEECLEREIKEELDIEVRAERLFRIVVHEYEKKIVSLHVFECTLVVGQPRGLDGQEFKWVKPSELLGYEFPPPDLEVIEILISNR